MKFSKTILFNNTNADIALFDGVIRACVRSNSPLPEEIDDLFDLKIIEVEDGLRGILNWA